MTFLEKADRYTDRQKKKDRKTDRHTDRQTGVKMTNNNRVTD